MNHYFHGLATKNNKSEPPSTGSRMIGTHRENKQGARAI